MLRLFVPSLVLATAAFAQSNFPPPISPPNNPQTYDKVRLGMALFFEEQLSSTKTVACATCHDLSAAGVDPRAQNAVNPGPDGQFGTADDQRGSPGIALMGPGGALIAHTVHGFAEQVTHRRAPTIINSGYHKSLGYAGTSQSLEDLVGKPLFNPHEMGHGGRTWNDVTTQLAAATPLALASNLPPRLANFIGTSSYPDLFQTVFGSSTITGTAIRHALSSYIRSLNSDQSKWDKHLNGQAVLTAQEQLGLQLFTSPHNGAVACNMCHSDFEQSVTTTGPIAGQMSQGFSGYFGSPFPIRKEFHNIGLRPANEDMGHHVVTGLPIDEGRFRIASLRNVELAAPFFHNGSANTLTEVIDFYDRGGDFPENQAPGLTVRGYTAAEKAALVAILKTLTDPRVAASQMPFDKPTLGSESGVLTSSIGTGSTTASGQMVATAPFAPLVGEQSFKVALSGVTPGTPTYLMWDTALASGPLPFNLELAVSPAFKIFTVGPATYHWTMPTSGVQIADVPIPNNSALSGQTLYAQWLALEQSTNGIAATSNALRIPLR